MYRHQTFNTHTTSHLRNLLHYPTCLQPPHALTQNTNTLHNSTRKEQTTTPHPEIPTTSRQHQFHRCDPIPRHVRRPWCSCTTIQTTITEISQINHLHQITWTRLARIHSSVQPTILPSSLLGGIIYTPRPHHTQARIQSITTTHQWSIQRDTKQPTT